MAAAEIANNVKDLHVHLDGLYKAVEGKCLPQLQTPDQLRLALNLSLWFQLWQKHKSW